MKLADAAFKFWNAANFHRRATQRDQTTAIAILRKIAETAPGKVQGRAADLLREIDNGTRTGSN
ncbi:hypothetical protein GOA90_25120 [Sinorhizobium meliloti]|nr:hypothetical protein [Sinorhizobium meliloti]